MTELESDFLFHFFATVSKPKRQALQDRPRALAENRHQRQAQMLLAATTSGLDFHCTRSSTNPLLAIHPAYTSIQQLPATRKSCRVSASCSHQAGPKAAEGCTTLLYTILQLRNWTCQTVRSSSVHSSIGWSPPSHLP